MLKSYNLKNSLVLTALQGQYHNIFVRSPCNDAHFKRLLTRCKNRGENYLQEGTMRCRETGGVKKQHPECPAFKLS
jgi:hypothetical protein